MPYKTNLPFEHPCNDNLIPLGERTIVRILQYWAQVQPNKVWGIWADEKGNETETITYSELLRRTAGVACHLRDDLKIPARAKVILCYPFGLEFMTAFLGAIMANVIPIPVCPPDPTNLRRRLPAFRRLVEVTGAEYCLTDTVFYRASMAAGAYSKITSLFSAKASSATQWPKLIWVVTTDLPKPPTDSPKWENVNLEELAYIQFTSGSTQDPKGSLISHRNLLENIDHIVRQVEVAQGGNILVSWLPHYHDMGLVGTYLMSVFLGMKGVWFSPLVFIKNPNLWLQLASEHSATHIGAPNFGYEIAATKYDGAYLDLSTLRFVWSGAEHIKASTMRKFVETFAPCGFKTRAFRPTYGLAENVLMVACCPAQDSIEDYINDEDEYVYCGAVNYGVDIRLISVRTGEDVTDKLGEEGEIWVYSDSRAMGYYNLPEASAEAFENKVAAAPGKGFLRTGDLGKFVKAKKLTGVHERQLIIVGRLKEIIIVNGRNIYPHDVEVVFDEVGDGIFRTGCTVVFGVKKPNESQAPLEDGADSVTVVACAELKDQTFKEAHKHDFQQLCRTIARRVFQASGIALESIHLIAPRQIPKSTSGKIQRTACNSLYTEGKFKTVYSEMDIPGLIRRDIMDFVATTLDLEPEDRKQLANLGGNLLETGVDSLKLAQLVQNVKQRYGVTIDFQTLFEDGSLDGLVDTLIATKHIRGKKAPAPLLGAEPVTSFPATSGQARLFFLSTSSKEINRAYHLMYKVSVTLSGGEPEDFSRLNAAVQKVVDANDILRTTFDVDENGNVLGTIVPPNPEGSSNEDGLVRNFRSEEEAEKYLNRFASKSFHIRNQVFDYRLVVVSPTRCLLAIKVHHIAFDGPSAQALLTQIVNVYSGEKLASVPQFSHFAIALDREVTTMAAAEEEKKKKLQALWARVFSTSVPTLSLPQDSSPSAIKTASQTGELLTTRLDKSIVELVGAFARTQHATDAIVLMTLFAAFVSRVTNQDDLLLASPISMRTTETAGTLGFMINTTIRRLQLRTRGVEDDAPSMASFTEVLAAAVEQHVAYLNDPTSDFETMHSLATNGLSTAQKSQALQLWFNYHRFVTALPESVDSKHGIKLDRVSLIPTGATKFPLGLEVDVETDAFICQWEFSPLSIHPKTMENWAAAFPSFIRSVLDKASEPVKSIPLIRGPEVAEDLLIRGPLFGEASASEADGFTLHGIFKKAVKYCPDRTCFADMGGMTMTYQEADHFSSYVAGIIDRSARFSSRNPCIALALSRGPLMVNCMLAVLKTGCHFVPLDLTNPLERNRFILTESPPCMLITDNSTVGTYGGLGICDVLNVSEAWTDYQSVGKDGKVLLADFSFQEIDVKPTTLAYMLYTSGSTGTPKACMLEHRNSVSSVLSHVRQMEWADRGAPRVLQFSRYTFDHSILEIFGTFASRGTLISASLDDLLSDLPKVINQMKANVLVLTPTVALTLPSPDELPTVGVVVLSGERTPESFKDRWLSTASGPRLFNLYGPTEAGIHTFIHEMSLETSSALIGSPLGSTGAYLLDDHENLIPQGGVGEIWVMGEHIGRGYFRREELTSQTFKPLAIYGDPNVVFHKTGDLARQLPSGDLTLLGRKDRQIKVRGVRVEPEEIEESIRKCASNGMQTLKLGRTAVILKKLPAMMEPQLVAFIEVSSLASDDGNNTPAQGSQHRSFEAVSADQPFYSESQKLARRIRVQLTKLLPPHMIPLHIVPTLRLPLTSSGKTDRSVLADCTLPAGAAQSKSQDLDMKGTSEVSLVGPLTAVFKELLGHDLNPDGDLFEQGLTSLTAMRALAMTRRNLGIQQQLSIADVMRFPSIRALSNHLTASISLGPEVEQEANPFACQLSQRHESFPLTELQSAYVVGSQEGVELGDISPVTYLELKFSAGSLDPNKLQQAWDKLVERHEALRIVVDKTSSTQRILPASEVSYSISILDLTHESEAAQEAHLEQTRLEARCRQFDLDAWPLFNVTIVKAKSTYLCLSVHLIIVDAKSFVTLMNDLAAFYTAQTLPSLDISYRDYILWYQDGNHNVTRMEEAKEFWAERVKSLPLAPSIPSNPEVTPRELSGEHLQVRHLSHTIPRSTWDVLAKLAKENGVMPSALLITTFSEVLSRWSENPNFTVNLTLFNRESIHPSVNDVVGDFTGGLLLEVDSSQQGSFLEKCKVVQASLRRDLQHTTFGSVSVLRELRRAHPHEHVLMPIVMTCLLEERASMNSSAHDFPAHVISHRFTQTPQVSLDFQAILFDDGLHLEFDFFDVAYPYGLPEVVFQSQCQALEVLPSMDWREELLVDLGDDLAARKVANQTDIFDNWSSVLAGPAPRLLHDAFFQRARNHPDDVAVVAEDGTVTYAQLACAAFAVSRKLRLAACADDLAGKVVPIALDRSWRQIAAVFGVLHAGGTYLPMGSNIPMERAATIMEDAQCTVIVGADDVEEKFSRVNGIEAFISVMNLAIDDMEPLPESIGSTVRASDPAYVIYTSGSTGKPKGVLISHEAALNTIADILVRFGVTSGDVCIGLAKLDFDLSVYDIFGTLSIGGSLALPPAEAQDDSSTWVEFVEKHHVTIWNTVPAMMELLLANAKTKRQESLVKSIRIALLSGDKVSVSLVQQLQGILPDARVWSLGGATEAAIWSLYNPLTGPHPDMKSPIFGGRVVYGVPLANQRLHVLNEKFEDCPTFVPGQLYISGRGLALGYTDDKKTREAFVTHPQTKERLYKTGDLCRYLPDGRVEIIGRTDFQRKIRGGHRVELGEVERQLAEIHGVREAVVDVRNDTLVAYLTADESSHEYDTELRPEDGYTLVQSEDRLSFKLERRGIRHTTSPDAFVVPFTLAQKELAIGRKSYRNFVSGHSEGGASPTEILEVARRAAAVFTSSSQTTNADRTSSSVTMEGLFHILGGLLFHSLEQNDEGSISLTKARYPSAGSSYSIRTYVLSPGNIPGFPETSDLYYLDPVKHQLVLIGHPEAPQGSCLRILFTCHRPALFPLYGQHSRDFAKAEMGYMLGIIARLNEMEMLQLQFSEESFATPEDLFLSSEESILGHITVEQASPRLQPLLQVKDELDVCLCVQRPSSVGWTSLSRYPGTDSTRTEWAYKPRTVHFHENADIIHGAEYLLAVSCNDPIRATMFSQIFTENALAHNVGFCHIPHVNDAFSEDFGSLTAGRTPNFILAGGFISDEMKSTLLTQSAPSSFKSLLQTHLREKLPRYMVPDIYVPLPSIPLTANGKIDRKRLAAESLPDSATVAGSGEPPQTESEKKLAILWANILSTASSSITRDASFFDLGGHSMSALKLQQSIKEEFGVTVPLKAFFDSPSLEAMSRAIEQMGGSSFSDVRNDEPQCVADIANRHEPFPTTQIQQAYLLGRNASFKNGSVATHSYLEFHKEGSLPLAAWNIVFQKLIRRHEALRLVFDADTLTQKILPEDVADNYQIQVTNISTAQGEETFELMRQTTQDEMSHQVLNPAQWPLFDLRITTFGNDRYVTHISFDMLIMDFYSSAILASDLQHILKDDEASLLPVDVSFRDYVIALDLFTESELFLQHKSYWMERVNSFPNAPSLPGNPEPDQSGGQSKFVRVEDYLGLAELQTLNLMAKRRGLMSTSVIAAIFSLVLSCWSETKRFALNLTVFNRKNLHKNINNIMGDFTSSLLLEVNPGVNDNFNGLVEEVNKQLLEDFSHATFTGVDFLRALRSASNSDRPMGVVLTSVLNDFEVSSDLASLGEILGALEHSITQTSQVTLDFQALKTSSGLLMRWDYLEDAFPVDLIPQIHRTFMETTRRLASADERTWTLPLTQLLSLTPLSLQTLPNGFLDSPALLHEGFHQASAVHGSRVAVISTTASGEESSITYSTLAATAQVVASMIPVDPTTGSPKAFAVLLGRSWLTVSTVLAVLYAGGYYVPLDVELPSQRVKSILETLGCDTVVTTRVSRDRLHSDLPKELNWIILDETHVLELSANQDIAPWSPRQRRTDIAYTIFTSGSTGTPKGVVITHEAAMNTINDINSRFNVTKEDVVLGLSKLNFDLSVYDIFGTLAVGGTLVLPPPTTENDPSVWASLMTKHRVSFWNSVPMMMQMLLSVESEELAPAIALLRVSLLSGDRIPMQLPRRLREVAPHIRVISLGGATEASIWSIIHEITPEDLVPSARSIPYGRPLTNQAILLVDMSRESWVLCPPWAVGSIFIGGVGLAAGYVDPQQTARAFFDVPQTNARLYDTGDLGRLLPSGEVEILGRRDLQVKVRGHRIELEEIEYHLLKMQEVSEAVVAVSSGQLAAYYVPSPQAVDHAQIMATAKRQLAGVLPGYMVPSFFVELPVLPLSRNGKVDRKALPPIDLASKNSRQAPRNETEMLLVSLCAEILQMSIEDISMSTGFVALGGHSLHAIRLRAGIREAFGLQVDLAELLSDAALEDLARTIDTAANSLSHSERASAKDALVRRSLVHDPQQKHAPFPLTPIQGAYLLGRTQLLDLGGVSTHVYLEFVNEGLDVATLEDAVNVLIQRHDSLRLVFDLSTQTQKVLPEVTRFEIPVINEGEELDPVFTDAVRQSLRSEMSHQVLPADTWPLFDIRLTRLSEKTSVIHMSMDMLIMDFSSIMIMTDELGRLLSSASGDVVLKPLDITFRDYVVYKEGLRRGPDYDADKKYWTDRAATFPKGPTLPLVVRPESVTMPTFGRCEDVISHVDRQNLEKICQSARLTPTAVLATLFCMALERFSESSHFAINLTVFDREPLHQDIYGVVGDFTTSLFLEYEGSLASESFADRTRVLQSQLLRDLQHGRYGGVEFSRYLRHARTDDMTIPVVFTSVMTQAGGSQEATSLGNLEYSISQTPQIWIDFQAQTLPNDDLALRFEYLEQIFPAGMIASVHSTLVKFVRLLAASSDLGQFSTDVIHSTLQPQDQRKDVNDTYKHFAGPKYLHEGFHSQVSGRYEELAVISGNNEQVSYGDLYRTVSSLAESLKHSKSAEGTVGILLERSWQQVAAGLAAGYAGVPFVPLDADVPPGRLTAILHGAKSSALVTRRSLIAHYEGLLDGVQVIDVDDHDFRSMATSFMSIPAFTAPAGVSVDDPAYVIFTSGSTGTPKGVVISHKGAMNTINDIIDRFSLDHTSVILNLARFNFDLSIFDFFGSTAMGSRLIMPPHEDQNEPKVWLDLIQQHKVTCWNSVPTMMRMAVDTAALLKREGAFDTLRLVMLSGDKFPVTLARSLLQVLPPDITLVSLGGATEASIWSIYHHVTPNEVIAETDASGAIMYGKPLANQRFAVVDSNFNPRPTWVPGEILIMGDGLALGYSDPDLTAKSFVFDSRNSSSERYYRTGDMGRYHDNGEIEFLGRRDAQVKIRGHRIELGEIEHWLQGIDGVQNAVCDVIDGKLVAFIVPSDPTSETDSLAPYISSTLRSHLPIYMIPTHFEAIPKIPLSANGKVNRKELRAMTTIISATNQGVFEPLDSDDERAMAEVWAKVLEVSVDVMHKNASFFELGGHSLLAIRLQSSINETFSVRASLRLITENPTLSKLVEAVLQLERADSSESNVEIIDGVEQDIGHRTSDWIEHPVQNVSPVQDDAANSVEPNASEYPIETQPSALPKSMPSDSPVPTDHRNRLQQQIRDIGSTRTAFKLNRQDSGSVTSAPRRDSHLHFDNSALSLSGIESWLRNSQNVHARRPQTLDGTRLHSILATFLAIADPASQTLTYQYPSAGSTYSVRVYVTLHDQHLASTLSLKRGTYFVNPHAHELRYVCSLESDDSECDVSVSFVAADSVLRPVYGDLSTNLIYSEVGYMMDAFEQSCLDSGVDYKRRTKLEPFAPAYLFEDLSEGPTSTVVSYSVGGHASQSVQEFSGKVLLYVKDNMSDEALKNGLYDITASLAHGHNGSLLVEKVFLDSKLSATLNKGMAPGDNGFTLLITNPVKQSADRGAEEGSRLASRLHSESGQHNLATCPVPYLNKESADVLETALGLRVDHILVGGGVNKTTASSVTSALDSESIRHYLSEKLPAHMVPSHILPSLPVVV